MKKIVGYLGVSLMVLAGCSSKTSVSLQFQHAAGEDVVLFRPVNYNFLGATDTLKAVKNDSVYQVQLDIEKMAPMRLRIAGHWLDVLVGPGEKLSIKCDLKERTPFLIEGSNATGQELYSRQMLYKNPYKYEWVKNIEYPLDSVPEKVEQYFRELQQKEIAQYDSLFQLEQISEEYLNYVRKDIRLYYSMTLSRIARGLAGKINHDAFGEYWTKLYNEHPLQEEDLNSRWIDDYAKLYVKYYIPYKEKHEPDIASLKEYYEFSYNSYCKYITNPEILKSVLGTWLYLEALNNKTESVEILHYFDRFNQQFPANPYAAYYVPFRKKLESYQQKIQKDFSPEVRFVEGYENIHSWEELMECFKGKQVFIDFWFSTCGPCRKEFTYAESLHKFLKDNQIEMLYVSIDQDNMDENWKNSIKYFDLKGWQVRASKALHQDFCNKYGIYNFPTYMLVDKKGEVVLQNAKRPSEQEALYQQITEALQ